MRLKLLVIAIFLATPAWAQDWCVDSHVDAQARFYGGIHRVPGTPAPDWYVVLSQSGIPTSPNPGVRPNRAVWDGISQQVGAGGPRGRLMLPTNETDALGYYAREADVLIDARGGICWQNPAFCDWGWKENTSQPPYAPNVCSDAPVPPPPSVPPTTEPPSPPTNPQPILTAIEHLSKQIDLFSANATAEHNAILKKIDEPGWLMKVLENRYVQVALAVGGTWLEEHLRTK